jgi:hypothetical protein
MKESRFNRRAGGLRGRARKILAIVIAAILTLAFSATALADSGKDNGQPGGWQQSQETKDPRGNRNTEMTGVNIDKIVDAIASIEDETVQANLNALLDAYMDALEAKQEAVDAGDTSNLGALNSAVAAAKAVLDAALEEAGIATDAIYGVPEEAQDGTGRTNNRPALNLDEIAAAIAALDDADENKAALSALLAAYQDALAALNAADASVLTEDELKALEDAVRDAEKALLEATKDADITGGVGRGQFVDGYAYGNAEQNMLALQAQINGLDDANEFKVQLQEKLAAYEAALAAEQNAGNGLTMQERAALQDATNAAADALQKALENAGLDTQLLVRSQEGNTFRIQVLEGDAGESAPEPAGFFATILNWLESLFK